MSKKNHYVDNKKFYEEMVIYKQGIIEARENGEEDPPATEYMGKCFLDIANGLSFRPNFINYTYKEEMISDGIENCLQYCSNFNPDASNNPFSYFTQIIYYAFVRRIEKEKKQSYIRSKLAIKMLDERKLADFSEQDDDGTKQYLEDLITTDPENVIAFETQLEKRKNGRSKYKKNLERFME
ncbi:hypothetical protein CL614_07610 [archaeon]|nr:hypothetical protein [archaeon]|tara:strand:- start:9757 stop:10302 length:546 start_codon:yes stop_codon:yes gene_type:complete